MVVKVRSKAKQKLIASEIEIVASEGSYALSYDGNLIETLFGAEVIHPCKSLLRHMIAELDIEGSITLSDRAIVLPQVLGAYRLFSIQKMFVETGAEELSVDFEAYLFADPILHRSAGPEVTSQLARWSSILEFLELNGYRLPDLPQSMAWEKRTKSFEAKLATGGFTVPFVNFVRDKYQGLPPERRTVITYLRNLHDGPVLFPLLLASKLCTPDEYASGVMAADCILADVFGITKKAHRESFVGLRDDARTALDYIRHYDGRRDVPEA